MNWNKQFHINILILSQIMWQTMDTNISVVLLLPSLTNYTSYSVTISTCVTCDSHLSQASGGPPTPLTGPLTSSSPRLWPPGSRSVATATTRSHQRIVLRLESFLLLQNCLLNQSFSFLITVSVGSRNYSINQSIHLISKILYLFLYPLPAKWSSQSWISCSLLFSCSSTLFSSALTASTSYLEEESKSFDI